MKARPFTNVYADGQRAAAYAALGFPGTYHLAFRDVPALIGQVRPGSRALDFGCGTGRSTRFLRDLGFAVTGVDIAEAMLLHARRADPHGDYRLVPDGDLSLLASQRYDLALSAFTFDNVPGEDRKTALFAGLRDALRVGGRVINIVSSPELYVHEWVSLSTRSFPGNRTARSGDIVRTEILDVADRRPVDDVLWTEEDYLRVYERAGLHVLRVHRPLGTADEPFDWVTETMIAPWTIYELERPGGG
jgi:SAM-dependent methyltransferase